MLRIALLLATVAAASARPAGAPDFFNKLIAPMSAEVQKRWGNSTTKYSAIEVDACRADPAIHPVPGGCMAQEPMSDVTDIGFVRVLYTPGTNLRDQCGPSVEAKLDVAHGNHSFTFRAAPDGDVLGDVCVPAGLGNASRLTVDAAFALAKKKAGSFQFFTINFRWILYPCVSEPTMIFTTDASNPADPGGLFVGVETANVCKTAVTRMYTMANGTIPPICQQPDRLPDCYH